MRNTEVPSFASGMMKKGGGSLVSDDMKEKLAKGQEMAEKGKEMAAKAQEAANQIKDLMD